MAVETTTLDDVVAIARQLSPRDRLRLIERLAADLGPALPPDPPTTETAPMPPAATEAAAADPPSVDALSANESAGEAQPRPSLAGLWQGIVPEISAEEFAEIRREAWKNFPREHFYVDEE